MILCSRSVRLYRGTMFSASGHDFIGIYHLLANVRSFNEQGVIVNHSTDSLFSLPFYNKENCWIMW